MSQTIEDPGFKGRIEGPLKVSGTAVFAAETPMPGLLHAALVQVPITCGEVLAVETDAALALPGVLDVVGQSEAVAMLRRAGVLNLILQPQIHFADQPVALVVAETAVQARDGAAAVRVRWREAAPVPSLEAGLADAYAPDMAGGRAKAASLRGDPAAALAGAAAVSRARYVTAVNNHHPMEPHAVVCAWTGARTGVQLEVHTCTQAVFGTRSVIAHALGLEPEAVRVVSTFLGGGFGCKGQLWWPWMMLAILAARRTGRPVRLELSRGQLFTLAGRRSTSIQDLAVGADADGRLLGIDHQVLAQTSTHAPGYADPVAAVSRLTYACANVVTGHRLVRTNEPQPVPMRGPGEAPGSFALETALNELADQLDIDPVALRLRNIAPHDQESGLPWSSNGLADCLRQGAERFGWSQRAVRGWSEGDLRVGWGMAVASYPARRQPCSLRLRVEADGTALVQCGTQDMGSGTYTALARAAAEGLGLAVEQVAVELGDTELPEGPRSAGSQVTQSFAPAMAGAIAALRARLAEGLAADPASPFGEDLAPEDLEFVDGAVRRRGTNVAAPWRELVRHLAPEGLEAMGEAPGMPAEPGPTAMGFGAVFAEVAVDPWLGEARVRRLTAAYAAGRILNPTLARNQYISGLIGGLGMALQEETVSDARTGRIVGDSFTDYAIPVNADMPAFDIVMVPEHDPHVPEGVKGIGMLGHVGTAAAIAEAIFQATGRRIRRLPIRVEDILGLG
ncbi:xanthine dehydrogenase family protein molybdopterin-binding subunit [Caulobacter sp. KR2-114]|uniref:xanthine dehydrogenase family protein molybdopterin-binding subunit n=1 Tax=Caulobacter sp. KR2-114 TaxID=3400912 RepID=UPI003BFBAFB4